MKESRDKSITMEEWSYTAFTAMLEFLYTGSVVELGAEVRRCARSMRRLPLPRHGMSSPPWSRHGCARVCGESRSQWN